MGRVIAFVVGGLAASYFSFTIGALVALIVGCTQAMPAPAPTVAPSAWPCSTLASDSCGP